MRTLLIGSLIILSTLNQVHAKPSPSFNACFKEQLQLASENADSHDMKSNLKALNEGLKSCKKEAAAQTRAEKKRVASLKKIEKLKAQLAKLTK